MVSTNFRIHLFLIFFQKKFGTLKKSCNFVLWNKIHIYYTQFLEKNQNFF